MKPATVVAPGDPPVLGPLGSARLEWERWRGTPGPHLAYADLDLAERRRVTADLGLAPQSDDRTLALAAYRRWGESCGARLGGQFAFAVWDGDRLVAFRDTIGFRPLVFAPVGGGIVIGGDIRSVLATDGVPGAIDEDVLVAAVLSGQPHMLNLIGRSCYDGIGMVRPAHRLVATETGITQARYWQHSDVPIVERGRPEAYVTALRELLVEVVEDLTPRDGMVGSHLSGALDSSVVTSLAARARAGAGAPPPLALLWAGKPAAGQGDDRVESVTGRFGLDPVHAPTTPDGYLTEMLMDATQEPWTMFRAEDAVRRVAPGLGVTTVVSGHATDATELLAWRSLGRGARRARLRLGAGLARRGQIRAGVRMARGPHRRVGSLEATRAAIFDGSRPSYLRPDALRRAALPELPESGGGVHGAIGSMVDCVLRGRRVTDWAREGARVGIAYRYPLLDRRLLRFWLSVPPGLFEPRGGDDRWMLRRAMAGLVPDAARLAPSSRRPVGWGGFDEVRQAALAALPDQVDLSAVDPARAAVFDLARLRHDVRDGNRARAAATLHWLGVTRHDAPPA